MSKKVEDGTSRRDFLKMAATGAPAVAVVTAATTGRPPGGPKRPNPILHRPDCKIPRTRALILIAPGSDRTISPRPADDWLRLARLFSG
jgi:hypothetical protein